MAFQGFGKNSGPSLPPKTQPLFGSSPQPPFSSNPFPNLPAPRQQSPTFGLHQNVIFDNAALKAPSTMRSPLPSKARHTIEEFHSEVSQRPAVSPPRWGNQPKAPLTLANSSTHKTMTVAPCIDARDTHPNSPAVPASFQAPKRTRSPSLPSTGEVTLGSFHFAQDDSKRLGPHMGFLPNNEASWGMWSSPLTFESSQSAEGHQHPIKAQRPALSPPRWGNQQKSPVNATNSLVPVWSSPVTHHADADDTEPMLPTKSNIVQVPKRTRSPPLPSSDEVILRNSHSIQDDTEREAQAKAKRLARFNIELSQPVQGTHDVTKQKPSGSRNDKSLEKHKFIVKHPVQEADLPNSGILFDDEGTESSSIVVGLCPDMCPESEREERERKGDLDQYERVDGDRNQTSRDLAVKKYNRMAEREVDLIRPLPVLQKTVDYLLSLLDQSYDDKFLGMYNFLWDRMRAIRMDLRMQHIFNQDAITMLEQMIRLHIIAMHELCEYTKGEGFSEGFDAHLNIEQMNKASVELFQLYDDHRKKGSSIPTEKEFRGYYALLKLDRHPGYKVEPAELSLDLAKMTPEIRSAPEILFARDVARACRTGNFIAFFRLARKATYLQACLMHAHFAKLRTQALACLHSSLQNNQGIPIKQVVKWLAMEEEDIENLLEYHGFSIKQFKDAYMMKEGPFLNDNADFPTKCSHLVHLKKSARIIDDVFSGQPFSWSREGRVMIDKLDDFAQKDGGPSPIETETFVDTVDEDVPDFEDNSSPRNENEVQLVLETPNDLAIENDSEMADLHFLPSDSYGYHLQPVEVGIVNKSSIDAIIDGSRNKTMYSPLKALLPQFSIGRPLQNETSMVERAIPKVVTKDKETEVTLLHQKNEAAAAKLRLMLRIWKRRSQRQRELREQRQLAASAALSSLSLGLPIRKSELQVGHAADLNINHVVMERLDRYAKSWSRMNVSEVVMGMLVGKNCNTKCICWKIIVSSQRNENKRQEDMQKDQADDVAARWLLAKVMGSRNENDDELAVSSPGLSIWKKWVPSHQVYCLSVIRHIAFDGNIPVATDDVVAGAGAIIFLISETIPWDLQRARLHNLLSSLPPGSGLPLMILIGGVHHNVVPDPSLDIVNKLGLHDIDKMTIATFSIVFLASNHAREDLNGFLNDDHLREGLQWLANWSPAQPVLHEVETRELVLRHLSSSLEVLSSMELSKVGPDHCISAFNDALDCSSEDIVAAANLNSTHWPSPEINLLDEFTDERRAANFLLPSIGWSSTERIESTISTIKGCKLPYFTTDLSFLSQGSDMGNDIHNQKLRLEKCLAWYLMEASKMMGEELAAREAYAMLQKGAGVEFDGSRYHIVPRWTVIFRRVFNWCLMNLREGPFSRVYILEHSCRPGGRTLNQGDVFPAMKLGMKESDMRVDTQSAHYIHTNLSLDEMVEISCRLPFGPPNLVNEATRRPMSSDKKVVNEVPEATWDYPENVKVSHSPLLRKQNRVPETTSDCPENAEVGCHSPSYWKQNGTNAGVVLKAKEADKLSMLLEQCNMLQDKIDEKLAIYF